MTYGIGVTAYEDSNREKYGYDNLDTAPHKEPKTISAESEEVLVGSARIAVNVLRDLFPEAREIDLLNAFLAAFRGDHDA